MVKPQELQGIALSVCLYMFFLLDSQSTRVGILLEAEGHQYRILRGYFWFSKKWQIAILGKANCSLDMLKVCKKTLDFAVAL